MEKGKTCDILHVKATYKEIPSCDGKGVVDMRSDSMTHVKEWQEGEMGLVTFCVT